eukprot:CAMPEP_0185727030 /NCGR_PEP_ID=MMETSP1171-20130828/2831_1 /TAXON_ID=374046 /ORGANISM="Helicotheca tamensis, Strain CCMP826" /LENGTH=331 /DNA_ID=CAMNT_0028395501 /DNA_START=150 /DNA_END=1145 /DNA_ORIENTATION=+
MDDEPDTKKNSNDIHDNAGNNGDDITSTQTAVRPMTDPPPEDDLAPSPPESGEENVESLSIEARYENGRKAAKKRHWQESPYAVGLVEPTWRDELTRRGGRDDDDEDGNGPNRSMCDDLCSDEMDPTCGCLIASGVVCSRLGAGRVGNMAVLKERSVLVEEEVVDEEAGEGEDEPKTTVRRVYKNKIEIVVGPYWPFMMCVTYPLIFGVSGLTAVKAIPGKHPIFIAAWSACTFGLIYSLFSVGCRDPGILTRHRSPPHASWRWNDQAQTYRPRRAVYDTDCACVIEEFDHTCPWTGTGIGKKNMTAFQSFVALIFICLIMDILLLTGAIP